MLQCNFAQNAISEHPIYKSFPEAGSQHAVYVDCPLHSGNCKYQVAMHMPYKF